jgi:putative ABC transport system substrate-binding protein
MSATQKTRPSWSGSRSMSLSRWQPPNPCRKASDSGHPDRVRGGVGPSRDRLVASLARPGGNVTGLANQISDTGGKKLELLREAVPGLRRLAIIANVGNPASVLDMGEAQATARAFGLEVTTSEIRRAEDISPAFDALKGRADALYVCVDPLVNTHRIRINTLALAARLPTMHGLRDYVEAGGLMSYGPNLPDLLRRAADYVGALLRLAGKGRNGRLKLS